jgi:hypothetical protein
MSMLLKTNVKVIVSQGDRERWAMNKKECLERQEEGLKRE